MCLGSHLTFLAAYFYHPSFHHTNNTSRPVQGTNFSCYVGAFIPTNFIQTLSKNFLRSLHILLLVMYFTPRLCLIYIDWVHFMYVVDVRVEHRVHADFRELRPGSTGCDVSNESFTLSYPPQHISHTPFFLFNPIHLADLMINDSNAMGCATGLQVANSTLKRGW